MQNSPFRRVVRHEELRTGALRLTLECRHYLTIAKDAPLPASVPCRFCRERKAAAWFDYLKAAQARRQAA